MRRDALPNVVVGVIAHRPSQPHNGTIAERYPGHRKVLTRQFGRDTSGFGKALTNTRGRVARHMMTWTWTVEVPFGISDLANGLAFKHFLSDGVLMNNAAVEEARPRDLAGDLFWLLGPLVRTTEEFGDEIFRVTHQTVEENSEDSKGKQPELQVRYP